VLLRLSPIIRPRVSYRSTGPPLVGTSKTPNCIEHRAAEHHPPRAIAISDNAEQGQPEYQILQHHRQAEHFTAQPPPD